METFAIILLRALGAKAVEILIRKGLEYLKNHDTAGIGNELATSVITAVRDSELNAATADVVQPVLDALAGKENIQAV